VVDDRLRVYGVDNLRAVDASIFPTTIRSNPVTTVYAVAEDRGGYDLESLVVDQISGGGMEGT
jgi:choline dehydrogenase-like flavoprotein